MKKYFAIFPFLFSLATFAASSNKCADVFANAPMLKAGWKQFEGFRAYNHELNPQSLKKAGFRIENDKLYELNKGPNDKPVGTVKVVESSHLFEWADKETKESWSPRGLTDEYMKTALKAPGQTAGKGFYISMDPIDSGSYGNALTTFRTSGPILVLEVGFEYSRRISFDTAFVTGLANAGIDGLRITDYTKTWLSMISNRHLKDVTEVPADVILKVLSRCFAERDIFVQEIRHFYRLLKQVTPDVWKTFPEKHILRRIFLRQEVKGYEFAAFLKKTQEDVQRDFLKGLLEDFTYSKNPEEALYYLNLLKEIPLYEDVRFLMEIVTPPLAPDNLKHKYRAVLSLFDLKSVATTTNLKGLKNTGNLFLEMGLFMTPENRAALETEAAKQKAGSIKHNGSDDHGLSHIFYEMKPTQKHAKAGQLRMLAVVLNEWTANAKDDAEFISRSRWSLEFFFRMYPEYRVTLQESEAVQ